VYKCIIPVETSLGTAGQPIKRSRSLSYPAWPYIDAPRYPCYLPTLPTAWYFEKRGVLDEPKDAARRAEEYFSRLENIEREIIEQATDFIRDQNDYLRDFSKFNCPNVLFFPYLNGIMPAIRAQRFIEEVFDAGMQGLIEGNRNNLFGDNEAFAVGHEYAHYLAGMFGVGGARIGDLAEFSQQVLGYLATCRLNSELTSELWKKFRMCDASIKELAQKFEPVEEIFATYYGLRFSPIEVRSAVEPLIKLEMEKRGWDKAYQSFTTQCDDTFTYGEAIVIYNYVCRMIERFYYQGVDIDVANLLCTFIEIRKFIFSYIDTSLEILEFLKQADDNLLELAGKEIFKIEAIAEKGAAKQINRILGQAGIPKDIYWTVSAEMRDVVMPKWSHNYQTIILQNDFSQENRCDQRHWARITLLGRPSRKVIDVYGCHCGHEDKLEQLNDNTVRIRLSPTSRIFFESIRQQLCQLSGKKRVKLVCPFAIEDKRSCCGRKIALQNIFEELPEEDKVRFTLPDCACLH
jgi:hypothetical protein